MLAKKYIFIFFMITTAIISTLLFYQTLNKTYTIIEINLDSNNDKKASNKTIKVYEYFVPVVGLKSFINDVTEESINNFKEILILKKDYNAVKTFLSDNITQTKIREFSTFNELAKYLNQGSNAVGIINAIDLKINVKAVSYEGIFLLNRDNIDNYKLKYIREIDIKNIEFTFEPNKLVKIGHTGSLIPARGIVYYIKNKFNDDFKRLFANTKELFNQIDFLSSTFEAPVLKEGKYCHACTTFVGPEKFMEAVAISGIDFFSLASNHIMDGDVEGLSNTQKLLDELKIPYTGASVINNDQAALPQIVQVNNLKIAYLAFNDTPGKEQWADENKPGAANISDWIIDNNGYTIKYEPNEQRIKYFVDRARQLSPDLIIVIMHWGSVEYTATPTEYVRNLANLLIKHGVDIIFGDHPHWVQEIEYINNKPVFYSVGNFIFDQTWSIETMQGVTIEVFIYDKRVINYRLHPHQIDLHNGTVILLKPNQKEYEQTLKRMLAVSQNLEILN